MESGRHDNQPPPQDESAPGDAGVDPTEVGEQEPRLQRIKAALGGLAARFLHKSGNETSQDEATDESYNEDRDEYDWLNTPGVSREEYHEWSDLVDSRTILSFRRGVEKALKDQGKTIYSTKNHFLAWGINGPYSPDEHAVATYFGLSDEDWARQARSPNPADDDVEFVPTWVVNRVNKLVSDVDLEGITLKENPNTGLGDIQPMEVETKNDKRKAMSIAELDYELRQNLGNNPQEQIALINSYILPRVDEQEYLIKSGILNTKQKQRARAIIDDIEDRLKEVGIGRMPTSGRKFDTRFHESVEVRGKGSRWMVDEELQAGYHLGGKSVIRRAKVNVVRLNPEDDDPPQPQTKPNGQPDPNKPDPESNEPEPGASKSKNRRGSRGSGKGESKAQQTEQSKPTEPEDTHMDRELWDTDKINQALDASETDSATNEQTEFLNKVFGVIHQSETVITRDRFWGGVEIPGERQVIQVAYLKDENGRMYGVRVDNELAKRLEKSKQAKPNDKEKLPNSDESQPAPKTDSGNSRAAQNAADAYDELLKTVPNA
ncbi:MAG: nucleotide exchange factor GrpE [Candidatus Saccharimonadales bacterium]